MRKKDKKQENNPALDSFSVNGLAELMPNEASEEIVFGGETDSDNENASDNEMVANTEDISSDEDTQVKRAIEAILMVAESPVKPEILSELLEFSKSRVEKLCVELVEEYIKQNRGFILTKVAGGYRFQSHPDLEEYVSRFALTSSVARLSAAALETLAIVAYRQPISRAQVAEVRGVNADAVMRTLSMRGLITEFPSSSERAVMFGTTPEFLEQLGVGSLDDLPSLPEFIPPIEVAEALEEELRSTARLNSVDTRNAKIEETIEEEMAEEEISPATHSDI